MLGLVFIFAGLRSGRAVSNVFLTEVPDYTWYAGCFGTASGNLMGYWDRHGFPDFYTGPTAGGVAPLDSNGANQGIRSMWASKAGFDGRPADQPGHIDDYWTQYITDTFYSYQSTGPDPYLIAGRPEHNPDCLGDFMGLSQNKWTNLNGECDGNIDAFSFTFWDATGDKRTNYVPLSQIGKPIPDIPSGLRTWTQFRGYDAEVFSQLVDFNPAVPAGHGFTFNDLKAEIDAGYPVLFFLQLYNEMSRDLPPIDGAPGMARANPDIHGILAYGYYITDDGSQYVRYRTSWGDGNTILARWSAIPWIPSLGLPVRGAIGYHPLPKITKVTPGPGTLTIAWDGPSPVLSNAVTQTAIPLASYVVKKSSSANPAVFEPVSAPSLDQSVTLTNCCNDSTGFYRVELLPTTVDW